MRIFALLVLLCWGSVAVAQAAVDPLVDGAEPVRVEFGKFVQAPLTLETGTTTMLGKNPHPVAVIEFETQQEARVAALVDSDLQYYLRMRTRPANAQGTETWVYRSFSMGGENRPKVFRLKAPAGLHQILIVPHEADKSGRVRIGLFEGSEVPMPKDQWAAALAGAQEDSAGADPAFAGGVSASTAPLSGGQLPVPGTQFQDCAECPAMVVIKPGSFMMGSNSGEIGHEADEGPRHMVTFAQPFAIGKYEVTFDEWDACVKDRGCTHTPRDAGWGRGRRPVLEVSWKDAMQYVRWLRRKTGKSYYLPSEAEWEYAARAGTQTPWNTGKAILTDDANILQALGRTVPVGGYPANAFGVHDVHGNVKEWVADCYDVGYFGVPVNGGAMFDKACKQFVIRGGSFLDGVSENRSAVRKPVAQDGRFGNAGFRVARGL